MAIEIDCPNCRARVRTPDTAAGKKGKCPSCASIFEIPLPAHSIPANSFPGNTSSASPSSTNSAQSIEFSCGNCQKLLRVATANAGKKGQCPHCGVQMQIPSVAAASEPVAPAAPIEFYCLACGKLVRTAASAAGKKGKCPQCNSVVNIPLKSTAVPSPSAQPPASPLPDGYGLTPLAPAANDPFASLGPVSDPFSTPAYGSFGGNFGGSAPSDPFASIGNFGMPAAPVNPYAAPSYGTSTAAGSGGPSHAGKPKRTGLPWDNRAKESNAFFRTMGNIISAPLPAFYKMKLSDTAGAIYYWMLNLLIMIAIAGVFVVGSMVLGMARAGGEQRSAMVVGGLIGGIVGLAIVAAVFIPLGLLSVLIVSAIQHGLLSLMGGAKRKFETTYRVNLFVQGTFMLVGIIPLAGGLLNVVGTIVYSIFGLYAAHETNGAKAAAAVLIPYLVCFGFIIAVVATVGLAIPEFVRPDMSKMAPPP